MPISAARLAAGPALSLGALGVVFGDIGTSPLYAMRAVLAEGGRVDTLTVYGLTSMVIWSLLLVVTTLYVGLLLRVDNGGEGGLLALVALLRARVPGRTWVGAVAVLGMAGAAMFLGDGVVTPAISVLSAAEGLTVANGALKVVVLPVAVGVLVGVFVLQRAGSGRIGVVYGPVMLLWFAVLAGLGARSLAAHPAALQAASPHWAVRLVAAEPGTAFRALGSVILVVTGAEALYADLGHFGRRAITRAWLAVVLPALILAYLGEAASIVHDPGGVGNPFYAVVPGVATVPVLVIATAATVIASEAVIAGAFTVLHQAQGLGFLPFLRTRHPSPRHAGQIYVPAANWALAVAVLAVVIGFRSSQRLTSAYGVAVNATILVTITLYLLLQLSRHGSSRGSIAAALAALLLMATFLASSLLKVPTGGWLPIGVGAVLFLVMSTWVAGQRQLASSRAALEVPTTRLLGDSRVSESCRARRCAVFLAHRSEVAPLALQTLLQKLDVLPEHCLVLSWRVEDMPRAAPRGARAIVTTRVAGDVHVHDVDVALGYRERLDVGHVLEQAREQSPEALGDLDLADAVYLVSESIPVFSADGALPRWRQRLFLLLHRLATDRAAELQLPRGRTIVMGAELAL